MHNGYFRNFTRRDVLKVLTSGGVVLAPPIISFAAAAGTSGSIRRLNSFPVYEQPDSISCGPTCCSMVLKYYGISAGIGPLKTAAGTRWLSAGNFRVGMTFPSGARNALGRYGVPSTVGVMKRGGLKSVMAMIDNDRPPILLVRSGVKTWHYIVAIGYRNNGSEFYIADPSGSKYWLSARNLDLGWSFSGDYSSGRKIEGRRCRVCGGAGRIAKASTTCPTCFGKGKTILGKCKVCGGSGKIGSKGVFCVACNGDGHETDFYRKVVESNGVSGKTLIVPQRNPAGGAGGPGGKAQRKTFSVRIKNDTERDVKYFLRRNGGEWKKYTLPAGKTLRHSLTATSARFEITYDSGYDKGIQRQSYRLEAGQSYHFVKKGRTIKMYRRR